MLYTLYETQKRALKPIAQTFNYLSQSMGQLEILFPLNPVFNIVKAQTEWLSEFTKTYPKPSFNINTINIKGKVYSVKEEIVTKKTFCELIHFKKVEQITQQPALLIVAPLSGHFSTLLKDTVKQSLNDFDVYITDWLNPAEIPLDMGDFGFDDYVQYLIDFIGDINKIHGKCDLMAVCQPTVPALVATAYLEKHNPQESPRSLTLMGGPIDTRRSPTEVNKYALKNDIDWFKNHVLYKVPYGLPGEGRLVYPGFLQHLGFLSMNLKKHTEAQIDFFNHLLEGADLDVQKHKDFYDEYNAVMDLPAKYYIETLENVFMDQKLAKGELLFKNNLISLADIKNVKVFAIEGENDDISGRDQTFAVCDLTTNLPEDKKSKYLAEKVGHYGVFSGRRWREMIYPEIVKFIVPQDLSKKRNAIVKLDKDEAVVAENKSARNNKSRSNSKNKTKRQSSKIAKTNDNLT